MSLINKDLKDVKVGIVGYKGRMGKEILQVLESKGINFITNGGEVNERKVELFTESDVVIDFTNSDGLKECLELAKLTKTPLVSGSTPMNDELMQQILDSSKYTKICWSANMSIGIAITNKLAALCAKWLKDYDCEILERHHNKKKDAPSGTAIMIGKSIAKERGLNFNDIAIYNRNSERKSCQIGFSSVRGGNLVGEHDIMFIGNDDEIAISHKAYSRKLFAVGAVECAILLIQQKQNKFYTMEDLLFKS